MLLHTKTFKYKKNCSYWKVSFTSSAFFNSKWLDHLYKLHLIFALKILHEQQFLRSGITFWSQILYKPHMHHQVEMCKSLSKIQFFSWPWSPCFIFIDVCQMHDRFYPQPSYLKGIGSFGSRYIHHVSLSTRDSGKEQCGYFFFLKWKPNQRQNKDPLPGFLLLHCCPRKHRCRCYTSFSHQLERIIQ